MADYICDAGHGCQITCSGSCAATYDETTGHCDVWCNPAKSGAPAPRIASAGPFSIHVREMPASVLLQAFGRSAPLDARAAEAPVSLQMANASSDAIEREILRLAGAD